MVSQPSAARGRCDLPGVLRRGQLLPANQPGAKPSCISWGRRWFRLYVHRPHSLGNELWFSISRTTHKVPTGSLCLAEHLCAFGLQVSHDILLQLSSSYMAADAYPHPLADLVCRGESKDLHSYFEQSVQNLLKESSEKFKGWLSTAGPLNTELSCKKVNATVWRGLKTCREMCMG